MCWKLGYLFCALDLYLAAPLASIPSFSASSLSQKNPPHNLQASILLIHLQWHKLVAEKHCPSANLLTRSALPASLTSPPPCELLMGMVVTPLPSFYITSFVFWVVEEHRPKISEIEG